MERNHDGLDKLTKMTAWDGRYSPPLCARPVGTLAYLAGASGALRGRRARG